MKKVKNSIVAQNGSEISKSSITKSKFNKVSFWQGFLSGILSSIVATIIYNLIKDSLPF